MKEIPAVCIDIHPPRLEVEGIGPIALPLLPAQAKQIITIAERAPYGRGTETPIDTDVRRTWQVGVERVQISGQAWEQGLATMVAQAAGLGVAGPVEAQLYKLLISDTGSFFISHRDSEKAPGMFATLVVVLPSDYSGGELAVRHKGCEARLDLRREEPAEAAFAAVYADWRQVPLWQEAHQFATQIRPDWPDTAWDRRRASEGESERTHRLASVHALRDAVLAHLCR